MNIHEYYTKMKVLLDSFRATRINMSDDNFLCCLLARLGFEYDLIVATINAKAESITLSDVYSMLLSQENNIEH